MFDRLRAWLLAVLHVPAQPHPPAGAPGSARTFRAGDSFYRLRLLAWAAAQAAALVGLVLSLWFAHAVREQIAAHRHTELTGETAPVQPDSVVHRPLNDNLVRLAARAPSAFIGLFLLVETLAVLAFLAALPLTYAAVRLDYELRWYIVTDRSLRIRTGLFNLQEMTMSFANLQQVVVSQGPLQRLLGIADVQVRSAGGGGGEPHQKRSNESGHVGVFHGVDNAAEIRDLILDRLRRFRAAGLGDPDEAGSADSRSGPSAEATAAAQTLLEEARRLRQTVEARCA